MALTLIEAAKLMDGEDQRQAIVELFAMQSDLLRVIPFSTINGNSLRYNQEDTLPGVGFRGVNEAFSESTGVINPQTESLVILGGDLDVDNYIIETMGSSTRATQESMKMKSLSHNYSNTFIKGDSLSTPKQFDGLQNRLAGPTGPQVISNDATADGGALALNRVDEAIDAVDNPTHLLMSKQVRRLLQTAARDTTVGGFITYSLDEFGRKVTEYAGLPILIADGNADLFATLANNEAYSGGGTADGTSIYVLELREGALQGIHTAPPRVTDLGELNDKPVRRTRVEWYTGMVLMHPRAAARLRDIDATLPATAT